jgi:hypothetical protein
MRSLRVLMLLCLLSLFVTYQQTSPATTESTVAAGLKKQGKEAYDAVSIHAVYYKDKLRQDLKEAAILFDQEIQALANKMREASRDARDQFTKALNDWRGQKEVLEGRLKAMIATCVEAWEAAKREIEKRMGSSKESYAPPSPANS